MGNLTARGLRHLDGSDLFRGFHHGKSRTLVIRILDFVIPNFPKWVILRNMASFIWTAQIGSYPCILPQLRGRGKINGLDTPMDLGDLRY
jgi:hypothetical protein